MIHVNHVVITKQKLTVAIQQMTKKCKHTTKVSYQTTKKKKKNAREEEMKKIGKFSVNNEQSDNKYTYK